MKCSFLILGMSIATLPWLAGAKLQADLIRWSASANAIGANGQPDVVASKNGSGSYIGVQLYTDTNNGQPTNGTNSGSIALATLLPYVHGNWYDVNDNFSGPSAQYQLNLLLHDQASGDSGTLTFHGYFSGTLNPIGVGGTTLTNTFVGPTTQTLKLGHDLYTATIGPVVLPESADNNLNPLDFPNANSGSISASIAVQPVLNSAPEPSSLMLACLGLSSLGLVGWRRSRQRRREVVGDDAGKA